VLNLGKSREKLGGVEECREVWYSKVSVRESEGCWCKCLEVRMNAQRER